MASHGYPSELLSFFFSIHDYSVHVFDDSRYSVYLFVLSGFPPIFLVLALIYRDLAHTLLD